MCLKEVELVGQIGVRWALHSCPDEESQFVRVLASCRNSDGSTPVEVEMAHLEGKSLKLVRSESRFVQNDVVIGRADASLPGDLANEEEIVAGKMLQIVNYHSKLYSRSKLIQEVQECGAEKLCKAYRSARVTTSSTTLPGIGLS